MQAERTDWNDSRLDEFAGEVHAFRRETTDRFQRLEDKIDKHFYTTVALLIAILGSHFVN